ncbi:hypothetical protein GCM10010249_46670 [Streptomyces roseolilacinus]|uniref:Uncharacterized protein n=1 Tax=Streptomyces roseolilacinus TaxID=66904 RepID=A0A918B3G4_9ACTN|nr:hypothetical protein GCM10010249_46670 [Streptomyces roseolilacinus]
MERQHADDQQGGPGGDGAAHLGGERHAPHAPARRVPPQAGRGRMAEGRAPPPGARGTRRPAPPGRRPDFFY